MTCFNTQTPKNLYLTSEMQHETRTSENSWYAWNLSPSQPCQNRQTTHIYTNSHPILSKKRGGEESLAAAPGYNPGSKSQALETHILIWHKYRPVRGRWILVLCYQRRDLVLLTGSDLHYAQTSTTLSSPGQRTQASVFSHLQRGSQMRKPGALLLCIQMATGPRKAALSTEDTSKVAFSPLAMQEFCYSHLKRFE